MNRSGNVQATGTITGHDRGPDQPKSKTQLENPIESRRGESGELCGATPSGLRFMLFMPFMVKKHRAPAIATPH